MASALRTSRATASLPVIEVFGPTIQGEGAEAGLPVHFVRLGGCDFRCSWCDTMYAVEPAQVRENAHRLTAVEIIERLAQLEGAPGWVVLSGGNPALHRCDELVAGLTGAGYQVAVETQGSVWRDWLAACQRITISPKPPSSGMETHRHREGFARFMAQLANSGAGDQAILKIVCFNGLDLAYAKRILREYPYMPAYLSAGTPQPAEDDVAVSSEVLREFVAERFRWLAEAVAIDPALRHVRVFPQLHVIAWGAARGV